MTLFILNLLMALLWQFLSGGDSFINFVAGYVLGFGLLCLFGRLLPDTGYLRRSLALIRFLAAFARELVISNLIISRAVLLGRNRDLHPDFVTYDASGLSRFEILILTHCITLTPGTTTVDISEDWQTLVLHAFDARDPGAVRASIDRGLRATLLKVTR